MSLEIGGLHRLFQFIVSKTLQKDEFDIEIKIAGSWTDKEVKSLQKFQKIMKI